MAKPKESTGPAKKSRAKFSSEEEDHLVGFLSRYEPALRTNVSVFRAMQSTPWGCTHPPTSWLGRYRRFRQEYDTRIDLFLAQHAGRAELTLAEAESARCSLPGFESDSGASIVDETESHERAFQYLPIPFSDFKDSISTPISETDQYLALNLAVTHLAIVHGLDPLVIYETWKLTRDLHLTDVYLREVVLDLTSGLDEMAQSVASEVEAPSTSNTIFASPSSPPRSRKRRRTDSRLPLPSPLSALVVHEKNHASGSESDADSDADTELSPSLPFVQPSLSSSSPSPTPILLAPNSVRDTVISDSDSEADANSAARHMLGDIDADMSPSESHPCARRCVRFQSTPSTGSASSDSQLANSLLSDEDENQDATGDFSDSGSGSPVRVQHRRVGSIVSWEVPWSADDSYERIVHEGQFDRHVFGPDQSDLAGDDSMSSLFG